MKRYRLRNHPTDEQVKNNANLVMHYSSMIRDSPAYYQQIQQRSIAVKRDLEYEDEDSRPGEKPTYPSHFQTIAPSYNSNPIIQKLIESDVEKLQNPHIRRQNALHNPLVVEWIITLLEELHLNHLREVRNSSELYLGREEHGINGNPH